ncbi:MAG: histidinol dehydrogenase [Reyranella sp.]|uniref:histidinol dehydrogenase n=1 Tax=Reyranella sp. TaxID=1929291 RepID=UPI0011F47409|nr:histidinol dehydrogenase [Reyranella sp.]TAJ96869.1 MAG: histidinol dehydrogenase [Reyranella sp.]TBR28094.1 MAG: histidinol dehydrogenase [Reyranella sp.]
MPLRLDASAPGFEKEFSAFLGRNRDTDENVDRVAASIVADVRARGDAAVVDYTAKFDWAGITAANMRVSDAERDAAAAQVPAAQREALAFAARRIEAFHRALMPQDVDFTDSTGTRLGARYRPVDAAGVYVPGGTAAYPSSVLMNIVPAKVAGVRRIVMVVPTPGGTLNPLVMLAAGIAGADEIWRIGGAQAVAALAYGTQSIKPVDKITGPGNAYVAAAKRRVFGQVGIDLIAGPSEILVVADRHNDPQWIAADLLSQAEHDPSSQSVLIADDAAFADAVMRAVEAELKTLARAGIASASWRDNGAVILVPDFSAAPAIIDAIAAEHVELAMEMAEAEALSQKLRHAGAIFLGRHTPEAIGDYVAGTNHVLPTSRAARFSGGLGVADFLKRTSLVACTPQSLAALGPSAVALADAEGLGAHGRSVSLRLGR